MSVDVVNTARSKKLRVDEAETDLRGDVYANRYACVSFIHFVSLNSRILLG